jgi:Arc/MetJ-type ribon-helix-helix transcriptional regulator
MSEEETGLHPNVVLKIIITKKQLERLQALIKQGKFKDESDAIKSAIDKFLAAFEKN